MEESALRLKRESQTALLGDMLRHWSQCSRRELERRSWPSEVPSCVSFHTSVRPGTNHSCLGWEVDHLAVSHPMQFPGRCLLSGVKPNNWQSSSVSEKCEKNSEANLCSNGDVLGGSHWFPVGGTFGNQKALWSMRSIHKKYRAREI